MRIRSALVWQTKGTPHREEALLTDEVGLSEAGGVVVLGPDGRRRAAARDELPGGSVLLVPPEVSSEELAAIQRSGYRARRSVLAILGPDAPVSEFIRLMAEVLPFVVVQGNGALNLMAELGGVQQTVRWLVDLADEFEHPVGINLPHQEGTRTFLIAPSCWSRERLMDWTAGHEDDLEAAFGEVHDIVSTGQDTRAATDGVQARADRDRKAAMAAAEAELEEVATRLEADLRRRHPELFDSAGRLRPRRYSPAALRLTRGKRVLTRGEVLDLGQGQLGAKEEPRAFDGS